MAVMGFEKQEEPLAQTYKQFQSLFLRPLHSLYWEMKPAIMHAYFFRKKAVMDQAIHNKIVSFIWGIADDVLRDLFKRGKYSADVRHPPHGCRFGANKKDCVGNKKDA